MGNVNTAGVKDLAVNNNQQPMQRSVLARAVRRGLGLGGAAMLLSMSPMALSQSTLGAVVALSDLDGSDGFVINGIDASDFSGSSVSGVGDVNGDGIEDLIIGADGADPNGNSRAGESYVVFGGVGVGGTGTVELSDLDGSNGFVLNGIDTYDQFGSSVSSAGDINGDGIDDIIIGAPRASPNGLTFAGESYVIFGGNALGNSGELSVSDLDGTNGFVVNGVFGSYSTYYDEVFGGEVTFFDSDQSGSAVSAAGDVNNDGVDDLIIGAPVYGSRKGMSYVVFGSSSVGEDGVLELSTLDGSNGFVVNGVDPTFANTGESVSSAGDVNGDGIADLVIGSPSAPGSPGSSQFSSVAGEAHIVFGADDLGNTGTVELSDLDGTDGFNILGIDAGDRAGRSVAGAGDFNGDGFDDIIVGAPESAPGRFSFAERGESYLIFGSGSVGSTGSVELAALDGADGFLISDGIANSTEDAEFGAAVSTAGDFNGDGFDDLVIGAPFSGPTTSIFGPGVSYVIYGGSDVGSNGLFDLSDIDDLNGLILNGLDLSDRLGFSVSHAGDVNGDGGADLIIGAPSVDVNGNVAVGASYVLFGTPPPPAILCNGLPVTVDLNLGQTPGPGDDVVMGTAGNDDIRGRAGNDTICGMGGNDFIHGNSGDDWIDGGDGIDNIRGGQGDDILFSGSGATVGTSSRVFGGTGDDAIFGGPDADDLRGGRGDDMISGEQGADSITGNEDDDILFGGPGADTLKGGNGENDELFGEGGADSLNGGSGSNDSCDGGGQGGDTDTNCEVI